MLIFKGAIFKEKVVINHDVQLNMAKLAVRNNRHTVLLFLFSEKSSVAQKLIIVLGKKLQIYFFLN